MSRSSFPWSAEIAEKAYAFTLFTHNRPSPPRPSSLPFPPSTAGSDAYRNFVIDAPFPEAVYRDPSELLIRIKVLTGVLEVGLFCGMCKAAYFGSEDGTISIK